ncbi:ankyrin repeat domain-containing protein, partial [Flavonifractor plautii]|nr:ankyrin repeat domain-containing protein [Flavonifractor plautii]MCQ4687554.1 ankyrin repeat domain-containing protein [Flavonifractor plautii]
MDKVANPSPALPGEVLRYAFGQNRAMARELIRWATPEQVAAAPSRLLCGAAYAHDLPMLTELLQKGLQPGDQAAPLLRPLLAAYDEQRVAHLLRDSLRVQPEDYEAM